MQGVGIMRSGTGERGDGDLEDVLYAPREVRLPEPGPPDQTYASPLTLRASRFRGSAQLRGDSDEPSRGTWRGSR